MIPTTLENFARNTSLYQAVKDQIQLAIYREVLSTYSAEEITECDTFEDFYARVEVDQGYSEQLNGEAFDADEYRSFYQEVFESLKVML